ncbi:CRISPR-associated protein [bacterium BMS3Abin10]|nr:CRISPR-associated protein [bacterium BMS3Abin10]GBE38407.1 CRISPR-associated protein [bacterium BMS3Bbin08]HEW78563.1 type I-C CRISPR-associated protein Cas8c/Csd1 [Phycisphaerales bacterium]
MIFQSLVSLYDRLGGEMPPFGFSVEDIGYVITIDKAGNLVGQPEDLRTKIKANIYDFRESVVPYSNQVDVRSGNAATTPNFMVDKADYIFGMSGNSKKDVYHDSFKKRINEVCGESRDEGVVAVKSFLSGWNTELSTDLRDWKEICGIHGKWVAFRLQGIPGFVHERSEVTKLWSDFVKKEEYSRGISFLDGEIHNLQPQYAQFKFGSGASLVSFNEVAYESYGKKKGENAPISVEAEFKSSSALKKLLRSRTQRIRIGDAVTVFWAERASPVETLFGQVLNPSVEDQAAAIPVQKFLEAVRQGSLPNELEGDKNLRFYILGLSLNKARLALRFWHVCSVSELMARFRDHFGNLEMEHSERDIPFPGVWHLLKETARETKDISPVLGGALTRSILTGAHYPQNLYQGVVRRIRADHRVNCLRASILKAVLQRNHKKEVPMSLDTERKDVAYLLGRLFAVLEKAQLDALGKVNSTIKDRFFSAASAMPASVFPRLLRLSQHHIAKAEYGHISDRRISEIMEHINAFPAHINLQDQGLFAIAYYHQKNALYRKNETKTEGGE